jgi:hypothetical protein
VCDEKKKTEIEQFLKTFFQCWDGRVLDEREDKRNEETLLSLGITPKHRAEEIKKLKYYDFYRGPSPDHANPKENFWEFGRKVKGEEVYIKIKVYQDFKGRNSGKCISFHFPDRPITYPCKQKGTSHV